MTVSRALRDDRSIPTTTRERIRAVAEKLGYRPDPLVSALMTNLRRARPQAALTTLAYITAYAHGSEWSQYGYIRQLREGAELRAAELGFKLEEFNLPAARVSPERLGTILQARGLRGVIVAPLTAMASFPMDFSPFAAAALGTSLVEPTLHRAQTRHRRNLGVAWSELHRLGFRRVGLILDERQDARTEQVLSSLMLHYHAQLRAAERIPTLIVPAVEKRVVFGWLDRHRPDAILSFHHDLAWWIEPDRPARPKLVNLNWQPDDGSDYGIDQQHDRQGAAAVDLVVEQLYANSYGVPELAKTVMLAGRWVESRPADGGALQSKRKAVA